MKSFFPRVSAWFPQPLVFGCLLALPLGARADRYPDFDDDAKPILRLQPGLFDYVRHTFEVRDTGVARIPGDLGRAPQPPFIFKARPRGRSGPYFITLLIQPGPEGRILKVIDTTQPHGRPPGMAGPAGPGMPMAPPPEEGPESDAPGGAIAPASPEAPSAPSAPYSPPAQAPEYSSPAPAAPAAPPVSSSPSSAPTSETPSGPTAETPSGPINSDNSSTPLPPAPANSPGLAPPPDPSPSQ